MLPDELSRERTLLPFLGELIIPGKLLELSTYLSQDRGSPASALRIGVEKRNLL